MFSPPSGFQATAFDGFFLQRLLSHEPWRFDEQFNYVSSNSGVMQVQPGTEKQPLVAPEQLVSKNGYLFVYVSNESPQDVYFDDLTVRHITGPLLEEKSYYPFGLLMGAISSRAVLKAKTAYAYNAGSEWEENGVEYYHTFYRKYDAQIGRFTGIDIASEEYSGLTPFQFGANNPVLFNDPFGDKLQLPAELYGSSLNPNMEDLSNNLTWSRHSFEDEWGWVNGVIKDMENVGRGANFWDNLLDAFKNGIDVGPIDAFITDITGYILKNGSSSAVFMLNHDGSYNYLGPLGGVLIMNKVLSNLLIVNTQIAAGICTASPYLFYEAVKTDGEWDYKNNTRHIIGYAHDVYDKNNNCTTTFSYLGLKMTAMDLGNLHYGIVGKAAGFSEMQLKVAAGLAQIKDGTSRDEWQTPYMLERYFGDDPNDQKWIGVGFRLYNKYFYSPGFKLPNWMSWLYRF